MIRHTLDREWDRYFAACRERGVSAAAIRNSLREEGYVPEKIDNLLLLHGIQDTHTHERADPLQAYLETCEHAGYPLEQARDALIRAGHEPGRVDAAIAEYLRETHLTRSTQTQN